MKSKETIENLLEMFPSKTKYCIWGTYPDGRYSQKLSYFLNKKVISVTEHQFNYSFIWENEYIDNISNSLQNSWRNELTIFEMTFRSQKLLITILNDLFNWKIINEIKLQYIINDCNEVQWEEISDWINSHQYFINDLKRFIIKSVYSPDDY